MKKIEAIIRKTKFEDVKTPYSKGHNISLITKKISTVA